jgi:hypothetical protein
LNLGEVQIFGNLPTLPATATAFKLGDGGASVQKHLSVTADINFGDIAAHQHAEATVTVTGATVGSTVALGVPNNVAAGGTRDSYTFMGWVSASNTVTVRCVKARDDTTGDLPNGTFRIDVWVHN